MCNSNTSWWWWWRAGVGASIPNQAVTIILITSGAIKDLLLLLLEGALAFHDIGYVLRTFFPEQVMLGGVRKDTVERNDKEGEEEDEASAVHGAQLKFRTQMRTKMRLFVRS
ncbi:hypothetical protein MHU86_15621 [Fragilaria crotonensis]|nr:hypothetical protein MHU86_15621 [Fragilaria crotonensis]